MFSEVLNFNTNSALLWKTLYVLGKSDLEAVETQLCPAYLSLSLDSKWSVNTPSQKAQLGLSDDGYAVVQALGAIG